MTKANSSERNDEQRRGVGNDADRETVCRSTILEGESEKRPRGAMSREVPATKATRKARDDTIVTSTITTSSSRVLGGVLRLGGD